MTSSPISARNHARKAVYEFLLWDNCSNNCSFCFQNRARNWLANEQKKNSIRACVEFLSSDKFERGNHVLLIGGEIFDKIDIADDLIHLFDFIVDRLVDNTIDILYITTNLLYKRIFLLYYLLEKIEFYQLFDRFKFATSYDIEGRFANESSRQLMLNNLETIRSEFPLVNITINTMLTKQACQAIIENRFDVIEFERKYNAFVHLIPYIVLDDSLTATREQIFTALALVNQRHENYISNYITNFDVNQDKRVWKYNPISNQFDFCSCDHCKCGHSENFKKYSSNGTCYICDLKDMFGCNG